jgi:hypothetical protein
MNKVVLVGVSLALGLGAGILLDRNVSGPSQGSALAEVSADGVAPSAPLQGVMATNGSAVTLDLEPVRAMVREELAAALSRMPGAGVQAASSAPSGEVSYSASPQQQQEAVQVISGLIDGGNWGNEERVAFHATAGTGHQ